MIKTTEYSLHPRSVREVIRTMGPVVVCDASLKDRKGGFGAMIIPEIQSRISAFESGGLPTDAITNTTAAEIYAIYRASIMAKNYGLSVVCNDNCQSIVALHSAMTGVQHSTKSVELLHCSAWRALLLLLDDTDLSFVQIRPYRPVDTLSKRARIIS